MSFGPTLCTWIFFDNMNLVKDGFKTLSKNHVQAKACHVVLISKVVFAYFAHYKYPITVVALGLPSCL